MPANASILDCGCGPGQDSEIFSNLGHDVTGIDITSELLEIARKRVPAATFIQMDMREIKLPLVSFDGVWLSFSFLHINQNDVPIVLNKFREIIKPNGKVMFSIHRGPKTAWVKANISGMDRECSVQEWVQRDFEDILENNGFKIEYSRPFERKGGRFPLLSVMVSPREK